MNSNLTIFFLSIIMFFLLAGCHHNEDSNESQIAQIAQIQAYNTYYNYYGQNDTLGYKVAMNDEYIITSGVTPDSDSSYYASCVYVFKRNSGTDIQQIAKLKPNDNITSEYGNFGTSIAISGNYILVGSANRYAPLFGYGGAYLFKINSNSSITQIAKIQPSDIDAAVNFGISVAISGDYIVVGANEENSAEYEAGSAYVFKRNSDTNITQIAKLYASDIEHGDNFGNAVDIDDTYIVIGALKEDTTAPNAGSAYLFKINSDSNVSQIAKLHANDASLNNYFGGSLSIDSDYIAIGAIGDENSQSSAYIFKRNSDSNITQVAKLQADNSQEYIAFGYSVSIKNNYIAIGAPREDTSFVNAGSTYVYNISSDGDINNIAKIKADNSESYDYFGSSVSINDNYLAIGSTAETAYIFKDASNQNR